MAHLKCAGTFTCSQHHPVFLNYNSGMYLFAALTMLLSSTFSYADMGQTLGELCKSGEVLKLTGDKGSCRIVASPKQIETKGSCTGKFLSSMSCTITYVGSPDGNGINVTCFNDPENPVLEQDMEAEVTAINVAAFIKKSDGTDHVVNDPIRYITASNQMIDLVIKETKESMTGTVSISMHTQKITLTNVVCK